MWSDAYIQIPFLMDGRTRAGLDCYGLVCLVYQEQLGIELNPHSGVFTACSVTKLKEVSAIMQAESLKWKKVPQPREFDAVLLALRGSLTAHIGVVVGKRDLLHITEGINSVVEPLNGPVWKNRVAGFYRHVNND